MRLAALLLLSACAPEDPTPVGVTLRDGQVLVGEITTETLHLEGALGRLAIPLDDIGSVVPARGTYVAEADGQVTVWLRNGTEFHGRWQEPALAVGLGMGGETVDVSLPVGDITAVQTRGEPLWSSGDIYRVRTTSGDDFLVDPERSRLAITNELGTFAPFLSECATATPIDTPTGDWRITLLSGTTLVGPLDASHLTLRLPLGPERIEVPIDQLARVQRDRWGQQHDLPSGYPAAPALSSAEGWFDHRSHKAAKQ